MPKRGDKSLSLEFFINGCSASEARQAVGSNSSVVNICTRRAVHTFMVWAEMLSSTGNKHRPNSTLQGGGPGGGARACLVLMRNYRLHP